MLSIIPFPTTDKRERWPLYTYDNTANPRELGLTPTTIRPTYNKKYHS